MNTEHLHSTLSPQAYAELVDGLRLQAERERSTAMHAFALTGWCGLLGLL